MTVALGRFPLDTRGGYWGLLHSLRENDAPTLPEDEFSPTIVDFIRRMMAKDPAKRSTAADLLKHPFVAKCKPPPQTNSEPPPNESQVDSSTARDELDDIVRHVMDYRYRVVRKRLKQLADRGKPLSSSRLRRASTLPPISDAKFKSLASQLGLPVKMVKMRFTRKRKQAQALLRKGAAALATLLPAAVDEHAADSTRSHTSHDDDDDEFKDDFGL